MMKKWLGAIAVLATAVSAALVSTGALDAAAGKAGPGVAVNAVQGTQVLSTAAPLKPGATVGTPTGIPDSKVGGLVGSLPASKPSGPSGWTIVWNTGLSNPNGSQSYGSVACPGGTVAWGGGILGSSSGTGQDVNASWPVVNGGLATGWQGYVNNATGGSDTFAVAAICAAQPKLYSVQSVSSTNIAGAQNSVTVLCPKHTVALGGGGFGSGGFSNAQNINTTEPVKGGWRIDMNNAGASDKSFESWVICGKASGVKNTASNPSVSNPNGAQSSVDAPCKKGTADTGGGVHSSSSNTHVNLNGTEPLTPQPPYTWRAYEDNTSGTSDSITGYSVCVKK